MTLPLRPLRPLAGLLACLLLASCANSTGTGGASGGATGAEPRVEPRVDVDTPALRQLKHAAGVEPCVRGTGDAGAGGLPDVTLPCLGGGPDVDLSGLRGPLVLNLFAQWCGPCREELPHYQALHRKAKGELTVLGVDYLDTQPERALRLVRQAGVTYPLVADPAGELRTEFKIRGLPGIVFVDASGRVTDVEFALIRSYPQLRALVREHLGVDVPA